MGEAKERGRRDRGALQKVPGNLEQADSAEVPESGRAGTPVEDRQRGETEGLY